MQIGENMWDAHTCISVYMYTRILICTYARIQVYIVHVLKIGATYLDFIINVWGGMLSIYLCVSINI